MHEEGIGHHHRDNHCDTDDAAKAEGCQVIGRTAGLVRSVIGHFQLSPDWSILFRAYIYIGRKSYCVRVESQGDVR
jgi:hypothetical protein